MTGKERVRSILNNESVDRPGFWLGNPSDEAKKLYTESLGLTAEISPWEEADGSSVLKASRLFDLDVQLHEALNSDLFWAAPDLDPGLYQHPEGKPMFDLFGGTPRESLNQPGVFAECDDIREVEAFDWPDPDYLNFDETLKTIENASSSGLAVFGGMWMPFFHTVAVFFGMENYFMKTFTSPDVVSAVTEKVLDFYLEANRRCLDLMGDRIDAQFFGNDLGSQNGLLIGPDQLKTFVFPGIRKIIDQAKSYDLKVVLHSCGAVSDIIPDFIDFGIDALHPLQARARGMDAETLGKKFRNELVFIGGVDTQELLPFGTPGQVSREVERIGKHLGDRWVVSPSHEALLENVSLENVLAMRDAAM